MRAHVMAGLCAALAVAGCKQDAATDPKTPDQAAKVAAELPKPEPGLYRSTSKLVEFNAPGLPPGVADKVKGMFEGSAARDFCLTPEEAARGYEERVKKMASQGKCSFDKYEANAGELDSKLTCDGGNGGKATFAMTGSMTPTGSEMTVTVDQTSPAMPGGAMHMVAKVSSQRVGPCV